MLVYVLESEGYRARQVGDGLAALSELAREPADLVLTDYMMPFMDGGELIRSMTADATQAATPVVVMSALSEEIVRRAAQPFAAFLRKPFTSRQLLECLSKILEPGRSGDIAPG